MSHPSALDATNRPVWADWSESFAANDAWTDPGERNALHSVVEEIRDRSLLDVGVGAGRSAYLLTLISSDYIGMDYTPEMVEICRRNHPDLDIRLGDARAMDFPDGSFDFVTFSNNGIDAVDHGGRAQVLAEFARVLRPGGILLFSALNMGSAAYRQTPLRPVGVPGRWRRRSVRIALDLLWVVGNPSAYLSSWRNWWRNRRSSEDHGDWGVAPLAAHHFGLLVHYTTVGWQRAELEASGFSIRGVWAEDGRAVAAGQNSDATCHHFVAVWNG